MSNAAEHRAFENFTIDAQGFQDETIRRRVLVCVCFLPTYASQG